MDSSFTKKNHEKKLLSFKHTNLWSIYENIMLVGFSFQSSPHMLFDHKLDANEFFLFLNTNNNI